MDNERQETIADIVSEIRAQNLGLPEDSYALSPLVCDLLSLARRIEVANAREREVGAEAAQICGEISEMIGMEATREKSSQVGNAAKMRDACANIAEYAKAASCHTDDSHLLGYLYQIERWAESALAAPSRNCDRPECATTKSAQDVWRNEDGGKTAYYEWLLAASTKGAKEGDSK